MLATVSEEVLESFTLEDLLLLRWRLKWKATARRKQIPPEFLPKSEKIWRFFGIRSGRGFGKTMSAANWIGLEAALDPNSYNFVIAPKYDDVRYTCFEGPTGLFSCIPKQLVKDFNLTLPSITLWNGSIIRGFSGDAPERLRGPQCHRAWCDEVASWTYPKEVWDNLLLGLRLGNRPQVFWTGTPKPKPFIRSLMKLPASIVIEGSTYENKANLAEGFLENILKYEGTAIGKQEIYGEILDPEEAGFIKRSQWRLWPASRPLPKFRFIIMSLDTAFTDKTYDKKQQQGDPTGCTVWGLFDWEKNEHVMLLDAWQDHLGFPELVKRVKKEKESTYGDADEPVHRAIIKGPQAPRHQGRKIDMILIEEKGSGISLRQSLAVEQIMTDSYNPGKMDKLSRLHAISPLFPNKRVWAVESNERPREPRSWAEDVINQVCSYIGEGSLEHDDLLDTTTQALKLMMDRFFKPFTVKKDKEKEDQEEAKRLQRKKRGNPYSD